MFLTKVIATLLAGSIPVMGVCWINPNEEGIVMIPSCTEHVPGYAFEDCHELKEVIFEEGSNLRTIGHSSFSRCFNLKKIRFPLSLEEVGPYSFFNSIIEEVVFEDGRNLREINQAAFYRSQLKTINIPKDVDIMEYTFSQTGCSNEKNIFVPGATIVNCQVVSTKTEGLRGRDDITVLE
mmetsp:Transcript_2993/g.6219  ORF Transcript_2993/g.6219 Transcript_2993/m.6219 type:complete len:180 (+) Transcript_2993:92-631(+)|eukprot:CAMPEP_0194332560 /NCGR_PEP_ID=MMETSP0171-20130528/59542_1 /TAXON_ID=218684 /ORGANISM="Corethron pennatum, Strain L29A3" /LENGTH=179 /DNA_ID=CAMNT_0039094465 /DNA_START=67 /DNA_END=606 /DNA_ORIENTATION=-